MLERAIQRLIQDPLAMKLLDGEVVPGDSLTIDADMKKGVMTFAPAKANAARTPTFGVRGSSHAKTASL